MDHSSPSPIEGVSALHTMMREFGKQTGAKVYDVGEGVCHQLIPEKGHVVAGRPHGRLRLAHLHVRRDQRLLDRRRLHRRRRGDGRRASCGSRCPTRMKVTYDGELQPGVFSKDLILYLAGQIGADGATYEAIEFHGPVIDDAVGRGAHDDLATWRSRSARRPAS